ncbi:MAG: hypothetical protein U0441_06275 [Polyangiaceae bacterium]
MNLRPFVAAAFVVLVPAAITGCPDAEMTTAEAGQALEESGSEAQASAAVNTTIDITTNFTIGQAVEKAADELKTFVQTQLPCAEVTVANHTLTIEYGVNPGNCTYKGQTYTGTHTVTISKDDAGEVVVEHTWDKLQNQRVSVSGTATVTWNLQDPSRHVVHDLTWTRLLDGRTGEGTGDVVQKPLAAGLKEGISVDGERQWSGQKGDWDLAINNVEMRWADPIPQAGSYELTNPAGKTATLTFTRVDADTIEADLVTGKKTYKFLVSKDGSVQADGANGS